MKSVKSLSVLLLTGLMVACGDAPNEPAASGSESDLNGAPSNAGKNALANLPPGTYLLSAVDSNTRLSRALMLTVVSDVAPQVEEFNGCGPTAVAADGSFASKTPAQHRAVYGTPAYGGSSVWGAVDAHHGDTIKQQWECSGSITFDGEHLSYELDESFDAPQPSFHAYRGRMGLGSVLLQAAVSNGGFGPGVQSVVESSTYAWSTPFSAVLFRTKDGRRFIAYDVLTKATTVPPLAVEVLPGDSSRLCVSTGATDSYGTNYCVGPMFSASDRGAVILFEYPGVGSAMVSANFQKPSWF